MYNRYDRNLHIPVELMVCWEVLSRKYTAEHSWRDWYPCQDGCELMIMFIDTTAQRCQNSAQISNEILTEYLFLLFFK